MCPNFNIKCGIEVFFNLKKTNKEGESWQTGWFHNLILDSGLDLLATQKITDFDCINVGTGSTEPTTGQTALDQYVTGSSGNPSDNTISTDPFYSEMEFSVTFPDGTFSGENIAELALAVKNDNTELLNRQLTKTLVQETDENVATGDGSSSSFTFNSSYTPIEPETISITTNSGGTTLNVADDGIGNLIGDVDSAGVNIVDYNNGDFDVTFSSVPDNGADILLTYERWQNTTITVTSSDELTVYAKVRMYNWFGEAQSYQPTGSFTFDNQVEGTTPTIGYTAKFVKKDKEFGNFSSPIYKDSNWYDIDGNLLYEGDYDSSITFTDIASGGPYVDYTMKWPSSEGGGDIKTVGMEPSSPGIQVDFELDQQITKRNEDYIEMTARISWGRYYGTS